MNENGNSRSKSGKKAPRDVSATGTVSFCLPLILCAGLGFTAGMINGLLGAAGGILLVSVLPYLPIPDFRLSKDGGFPLRCYRQYLDSRDFFATSLAVMLPISAISFARYWLSGVQIDFRMLTLMILPAVTGGLLGAWLLDRLSPRLLRLIFSAVIVLSGLRMLL